MGLSLCTFPISRLAIHNTFRILAKKIKYEKQEDGFYHLSRHLTSEKGRGHNLLLEIFCNGYFKPSLFEVVQRAGY
ncbi:hypothetical protein CCAND95_190085 [Capnocytophaga canis]|nr:hypothetical protein CCAND95_190085 [Capnocytophaga canis]